MNMTPSERSRAHAHPGRARTLADLLRHRWSSADPRCAYTFLDDQGRPSDLPLAELRGLALAAAHRLRDHGVQPGDRVLLAYPPDGLDFVVGFAGCMLAGAIAVPVQTPDPRRLRTDLPRLAHIARDCGARVALTTRAYKRLTRLAAPWAFLQRVRGRPLPADVPDLDWLTTDGLRPAPASASDALVEASPDDVAYLQYTSGSTGEPRGVRVSHRNALHNLSVMGRETEVGPDSVLVGWVPLFHDMGLVGGILNILYSGGHLVFFSPMTFLARPGLWLEAITRWRGTHLAGPDFGYAYLLSRASAEETAAADLSSVRFVLQGGEVARAETVERLLATLGPAGLSRDTFHNIYGMAESTLYVCGRSDGPVRRLRVAAEPLEAYGRVEPVADDGAERTLVSCGAPAADVGLIIVQPDSLRRLGEDQVGEVWIASPSVSDGYWCRQDGCFSARLAHGGDDGTWLRTGDLGFLHDGELYLCGRHKELVILGGRNLYPHDLEASALASHPGLRKGCAVVLSVDAGDRERLVLLAELRDDATPAATCEQEIAPAVRAALHQSHQVSIDTLVLLRRGQLPKTSSGKLQRGRTRRLFLDDAFDAVIRLERARPEAPAPDPSEDRLEAIVHAELALLLGTERVDLTRSFEALGVDSIAGAQLVQRLGERVGRELPADVLLRHPSPERLLDALRDPASTAEAAPSTVRVRLATREDLSRLGAYLSDPVIDESFTSALSARPETIPERLEDRFRRGVWLLGEVDGRLQGCLAVVSTDQPHAADLSTFSVHPDARLGGVGEALYAAALDVARERMAARRVFTDSWEGNEATAAALRAAGFREVDRYADPRKRPDGVRTVLYRKDLVSSGEVCA